YRNGKEILDTETQGEWSINIHLWLPLQQDEPAPVVVYGHGINNTAEDGALIAQHVVPMGLAVVSADALFHGSHPTANPDAALPALNFLGVNLSAFVFDTPNLRGSFGQSTAERLQMIRLLEQNPDVDGDGVEDLDMRTLIYHGFSLGGMMGPQLLATKPTFGAAALVAGGGNLPLFVTDTQVMQDYLLSLMEVLVGTRDDYDIIVPVIQAAVDESDPAIWARHILENRLDTADPPDLLFPVSVIDGDVPPSAGQALARAFEIPHLSPISTTVSMLEEAEGPLHANLESSATAAYFQLDRVSTDAGIEAANHDNVAWNAETMWMITHFLQSYLDGRTEIAEPYSALGTPPLE
ncbi:MAG: hypothetical protein VX278_24025, partial [Myxococcota bacterium]|nr:hypothetical protein [Myxococcota bacterium]